MWDMCGRTGNLEVSEHLEYRVFSNLQTGNPTSESDSVPGHHHFFPFPPGASRSAISRAARMEEASLGTLWRMRYSAARSVGNSGHGYPMVAANVSSAAAAANCPASGVTARIRSGAWGRLFARHTPSAFVAFGTP